MLVGVRSTSTNDPFEKKMLILLGRAPSGNLKLATVPNYEKLNIVVVFSKKQRDKNPIIKIN